MSDVTLPMTRPARRPTWRDAITPEGRASRRRWTLVFPVLLCLTAWIAATNYWDGGSGGDVLLLFALFVVFGMLRRSTRRLTALDHPDLDERDRLARDRAFRLGYPLLLAVIVVSLGVLALVLPDASPRQMRSDSGGTILIPGSFLQFEALLGLVGWLAIWATFLPTGVLAWCEPDALHPDPGESAGGLSETARDGVLASALAAGLLVGIVQDVQVLALMPFLGALALLGRLAKRPVVRPTSSGAP